MSDRETDRDKRSAELYAEHHGSIVVRTDRLFAVLLGVEWVLAVVLAVTVSPRAWEGVSSGMPPRLAEAVLAGGLLALPVAVLAFRRSGRSITRHSVAVAQMWMSALFIHLTGGRIETHFHVFGSLALLAFYRDGAVLLTATATVTADHLLRGLFWPQTVYGVAGGAEWRWLEHAGWALFEDAFLWMSLRQTIRDMREIARQRAEAEQMKSEVDDSVATRTAELRRSEERFSTLVKAAQESIREWNLQTGRVWWSGATSGRFGYGTADVQLDSLWWTERVHPDDRYRVMREIEALVDGRAELWTGEYRFLRKDGSYADVQDRCCLVRNEQGRPSRILGALADISERKRLEQEHAKQVLQLSSAHKLESIGQLAAGIAHEINTPIQYVGDNLKFLEGAFLDVRRVIETYAAALVEFNGAVDPGLRKSIDGARRDSDLDYLMEEVPRALVQSREGVSRVSQIVRAMKDFSHPGAEVKTPTDLNRALETTITVARNEWKYVAEAETDFDPSLALVPVLPGEINQVFLNLIVNAAHAIGDVIKGRDGARGTIRISTKRAGSWAEVRVSDTGTGIPQKHRGRIFEPFFTTKPVGKGTGQGLALSHAVVVNKHQGTLTFETDECRGTTFIVRLPMETAEGSGR